MDARRPPAGAVVPGPARRQAGRGGAPRGAEPSPSRSRRTSGAASASSSSRTSTSRSGPRRESRRATCSRYYRDIAPVLVPHLQGPAVHDEALPRRLAGQVLLPEGRAVAHARLDPALPRARLDAREAAAEEVGQLPARERRARAALDGEHGLHRHEHVVLARSTSPTARTSCSSTSIPRPTSASPRRSRSRCSSSRRSTRSGSCRFPKTSGADGMHVLVPIERRHTYDDTRRFAEIIAGALARTHRGLVTTEWTKSKRRGVLIDANQNGEGKTIASVYCVRPKAGAPVSTPLRWDEVNEKLEPGDLLDGRRARPRPALRRPLRGRADDAAVAREGVEGDLVIRAAAVVASAAGARAAAARRRRARSTRVQQCNGITADAARSTTRSAATASCATARCSRSASRPARRSATGRRHTSRRTAKTFLAQWSAECEVPFAFARLPFAAACRAVVTGRGRLGEGAAVDRPTGWTEDGRAIVRDLARRLAGKPSSRGRLPRRAGRLRARLERLTSWRCRSA